MGRPRKTTITLCSINDCGRKAVAKGLCSMHWQRQYSYWECSVEGCHKPARGRGYCSMHYGRELRHGNPLAGRTPNGNVDEMIADVIAFDGIGCLIWPYARNKRGYATAKTTGRSSLVSRIVCEAAHGPPPFENAEAAHLCFNGHLGCVAKNHLQWQTRQQNMAVVPREANGRLKRSMPS